MTANVNKRTRCAYPRLGHQRSAFQERKEKRRKRERGREGRTVDAAAAAETLPRLDDGGAAAERGTRAPRVCAHGARARREVRDEKGGVHVCWVVVRRGARFQHEDA
jgi:hypothetical protein